jgi:DNA-binding beta-propeller fold protein YncE
MNVFQLQASAGFVIAILSAQSAGAADLIVSANDGKFVRVEGVATYPQPVPSDSLAVIDASQFPPVMKAVVRGVEHTVAGPPQAVAITPDGRIAMIGAPSKYDYAARKETFGTFLQVADLEASPPHLLGRVDIGAHPNGLAINPAGTLLLAATLDGSLKVLGIAGKELKLIDSIKISEKRLSSVSFTHDGKAALVSLRDEGGVAVLTVDGAWVTLTKERVSSGIAPYAIDISSDGKWAVVGNAGLAGLPGQISPGDADLVTLIDVSKRPFRAVQHLTVPATPEGVALSPDGNWIVAQTLNGSNLTPNDPGPGRQKLGRVVLFAIKDGVATRINELPSGEAAQGIVFVKDSKTILVQFDVEKALAVYQIRDGHLVDTTERLKLEAGPVSIRSMPR